MFIKEMRDALIGKEMIILFVSQEETITVKGLVKKIQKKGNKYIIYGKVPDLKEDKLQLLGQFTHEAIESLINGTILHNKYQDKVIVHKLGE